MKKSILCILLAAICVTAFLSSCSHSPSVDENVSASVSASPVEKYYGITLSGEERSLAFRYFYMNQWKLLCYNSANGIKYGKEGFDASVSPDLQYYVSEDGTKTLWSEHLTMLTANVMNRALVLYKDAEACQYMTESLESNIIENIASLSESARKENTSDSEYIAKLYGNDFTIEFFERIIAVDTIAEVYPDACKSRIMSRNDSGFSDYTDISEYAETEYESYLDDLLKNNTQKVYQSSAEAQKGASDAGALINKTLAERATS